MSVDRNRSASPPATRTFEPPYWDDYIRERYVSDDRAGGRWYAIFERTPGGNSHRMTAIFRDLADASDYMLGTR
jgi:hypothetical protein